MLLALDDPSLSDRAAAYRPRLTHYTGLLNYIDFLPAYDTLRDDPRYTSLLRRMGLRP